MKVFLTCALLGLIGNLLAQYPFSREFTFSESTEAQSYDITVAPGTDAVSLKIKATLEAGTIRVSLIDPKGEDHGHFSLSCEADEEGAVVVNSQSKEEAGRTNRITSSSSGSSSSSASSSSSGKGNSSSSSSISTSGKEGKKNYTYSYSSISETDQRSRGTMKRRITDPSAGTWQVVIEASEATGEVNVKLEME